jgi:hypothetical protein
MENQQVCDLSKRPQLFLICIVDMDHLIKYDLVLNHILWYFVEIEVSFYSHS